MRCVLVFLLLLQAAAPTFGQTNQCLGIGDVAFAIDGSESVGETNFELLKNFTIESVDKMVIGPNGFNIAAMIFSSSLTPMDQFDFHEYQEKQHLEELIRNFLYIREGTRTDLAIKRMQEMLEAAPRKTVPKIMIVITDGKSAIPAHTIAAAMKSKSRLTQIIVVGVNIDSVDVLAIHEINAVASGPDKILWVSFKHLNFDAPDQLLDIVCQIATTTTTSTTTTTTTTIPPPTSTTTTTEPTTIITTPTTSTTTTTELITTTTTPTTKSTTRMTTTTRKTTKRPHPAVRTGGTVPEECTGCFIQDGLGYNPHLQLCYKFYHCVKENDDVIKYLHTCPFGMFWSQKVLACVDPKVAVCDKDPCKQMDHVGMRYEMGGVCNGYWECVNEEGKIFSKAMCCSDGHVYEPFSAICVRDTIRTCNNTLCGVPKPKDQPFVCPYEPVLGDIRKFRSNTTSGLMIYDLPCSPGTIFDPDRCTCVNENIITVPIECKPEIHMKFDGNFMDKAGADNEKAVVKVTLMNSDPSPAGGSYAYFNGSSYINLYSLANTYYGRTVAIHFWMRPLPGIPDGPETVITNCLMSTGSESNQCLYSDCNPSIQIELSNLTNTLNHKLVMEDGDTYILKSNISFDAAMDAERVISKSCLAVTTLGLKKYVTEESETNNTGEWMEVWYVYDGSRSQEFVTGTSSSTEDHVMTTGIVGQRQSGIVIGRPITNAFNNYYKGDIDEFEFYRCIPEKAKDALKNIN